MHRGNFRGSFRGGNNSRGGPRNTGMVLDRYRNEKHQLPSEILAAEREGVINHHKLNRESCKEYCIGMTECIQHEEAHEVLKIEQFTQLESTLQPHYDSTQFDFFNNDPLLHTAIDYGDIKQMVVIVPDEYLRTFQQNTDSKVTEIWATVQTQLNNAVTVRLCPKYGKELELMIDHQPNKSYSIRFEINRIPFLVQYRALKHLRDHQLFDLIFKSTPQLNLSINLK